MTQCEFEQILAATITGGGSASFSGLGIGSSTGASTPPFAPLTGLAAWEDFACQMTHACAEAGFEFTVKHPERRDKR